MTVSDNPAVMGTTINGRYLEDGSIELTIVIPERSAKCHTARLMEYGSSVGLVELKAAKWGRESQQLRLSRFFYTPDVWQAIGTDDQYQAWCRTLRSAHSKRPGVEGDPIVFAHVRRVHSGSGMAKKPPFSGIPLLNSEHQLQHQKGETALLDSQGRPRTRAWYEKAAIDHVVVWAWSSLKTQLNYEHWPRVPPEDLLAWAQKHDVVKYLPACYRQARGV